MGSVSYRDDLDAAHARIAALEAELAATKRGSPPPPRIEPVALQQVAPVAPSRRRVHYHAPPTYWPMLRQFFRAVPVAFDRRPGLRKSTSDNVLAYVARNYLARPFVLGVWSPIYCLALSFALPMLCLVYIALSILLLPLVAISCVSFSPRYAAPKWLDVKSDDPTGVLFWLLMGPWIVLFVPALLEEDEWPRR